MIATVERELKLLSELLEEKERWEERIVLNEEELIYITSGPDVPLEDGFGYSHEYNREELSFDMEEEMEASQLHRRLKHAFVQQPARRKIEEVDEWLVMGDETIFVRTVTVPVSLEGRITRRKHSHDRSWGGKYRPWSGWVTFSTATADGYYRVDELDESGISKESVTNRRWVVSPERICFDRDEERSVMPFPVIKIEL